MKKQSFVAGVPGDDPTLPNVELVLGGKSFQLCYDHNAIAQVENQLGLNLMEAQFRIQTANELRATLWAAIIKHQPDVTLEEVGDLLRPHHFLTVRKALEAAWFGSVPEPKPAGEVEGAAAPTASPSQTSGPEAVTTSA